MNSETKLQGRKFVKMIFKINYYLGFLGIGVWVDEVKANKKEHLDIYKKWLGSEFKVDFDDENFGYVISNHTGIFEIQYLVYKYAPGFISKMSIKKVPFVGFIADKLETLWLDRKNDKMKNIIVDAMNQRMDDYMNKKVLSPLMVFPEGTTTTGNYLLKFKKGAFVPLKPLKSILFKSMWYDIGEGVLSTHLEMFVDIARPMHRFRFWELPVIYPTEYMFENYMKIHPEITNKAEIYAEVTREIWAEIGGFKKSDKSYDDYLNCLSLTLGEPIKNT